MTEFVSLLWIPGKKVSIQNKATFDTIMPPIIQSKLVAVFIKDNSMKSLLQLLYQFYLL